MTDLLRAESVSGEVVPALAVALVYVPSEDRCYHTPFTESEDCPDPLSYAHAFREAEEERGDFPGSLWTVTGDDRATQIRADRIMARLGFGDEGC